jgi:hypothetical protein
MGSTIRTLESTLAALVVLVAVLEVTGLPRPYPAWPTVGPVPADPELVVPGLLGLVAVVGAIRDGIDVGSVVVGGLGALTLWLAATSLYALFAGTAGGVFWGGFFTLVVGVPLAVAVLVRTALGRLEWRRPRRIRDRFRA